MTPRRWIGTMLLVAGGVCRAGAQTTTIDLSRQGKLGTGTSLPAQCAAGQIFFKTNAPAGNNVYTCTSGSVWTPLGVTNAGDGIVVIGNTVAVEDAVVPMYYTGAGVPAITCTTGRDFYIDTNAAVLYYCKATGQWQAAGNLGANTYPAGQKQSVSHDSNNAGLRLAPAAGDPANAQDGDLWYNATTNSFRRRQAGAVADLSADSGGFDANDTTTFWLIEEFPPSGVSSSYMGTNGWTVTNFAGGCSPVFEKSFTNRPGVLDLQANGSNAGCAISLDGLFPSMAALTWKAKWSWSAASTYTSTNFIIRVGIGNGANSTTTPSDGVWAKFLQGTDTNWRYELYSGGSPIGSVDSGVAFNADNLYTAQYRGDGSKWYVSMSTNGGAFSTEKSICPSGCDVNGALPNLAVGPFASILHTSTLDGGTKRLYVDRFSIQLSGLAR